MSTSTTTNYGWTIPNDDELVKNGAAAIRTLGQAIDTTAAANFVAGLVHIETQTFSAVSAVNFSNDVFSSTYDNYKILFKGVGSTTVECRFRLRVAGVDNSTANSYVNQRMPISDTATTPTRQISNQGWLGTIASTAPNSWSAELFNPFLAVPTAYISHNMRYISGATIEDYYGSHNQSTSYDSINIIASTGTFTGEMSVYGYRK